MINSAKLSKSRNYLNVTHWKIRSQIIAIILGMVLLSVIVMTVFSYVAVSNAVTISTGQYLSYTGDEILGRINDIMVSRVDTLEALALSPAIIEVIEAANHTYEGRNPEEIKSTISQLDDVWQSTDLDRETLVTAIEQNEVSDYLRQFKNSFPEEAEIFITDRYGLNVAMTEPTSDYFQADESWWQGAYNDGNGAVFVGDVEYDESAQSWAVNIGVPIHDKTGENVIGVLRGTVDVSVVFEVISKMGFNDIGAVTLLDKDGKVIYTHNQDFLMQPAPERLIVLLEARQEGWQTDVNDLDGIPTFLAYQFMSGEFAETLGWALFVEEHLSDVYAPARSILIYNLVVAAIIAIVLAVLGVLAARSIAKPLTMVTAQVHRLAIGDLSAVEIRAGNGFEERENEIGELIRAFQELQTYIQEVALGAQRIAQGDLVNQLKPRSEKDVLGKAFTKMTSNLRQLIGGVIDNASKVGGASFQLASAADQAGLAASQIADVMQQMARVSMEQNANVTHVAASVEQMAHSIDGVARGAQEQTTAAAKSADLTNQITSGIQKVATNAQSGVKGITTAAQIARDGVTTVEETLTKMKTIKIKVGLSAQKVEEMGQRSGQIGAIVETIDDIASQTNLLALNAAIEAARAGEHGKGFAVVADEVRKLAEKSAEATKEIAGLIKSIQQTVAEAVQAMGEGTVEVETGVSRADAAGQALYSILEAVEVAAQQIEGISSATQQMSTSSNELMSAMEAVSAVVKENTVATEAMAAGSSEVSHGIDNITSVSKQNSSAVEEVSAATEEMSAQVQEVSASAQTLNDMAQALRDMVVQFKLSGDAIRPALQFDRDKVAIPEIHNGHSYEDTPVIIRNGWH
ncbi:MAG: HAMP domain-containing protein [Anaerolineae bacterium]|nr:HAMP domain-containing protein [Anaerolineae bacterium]